MIFKLLLVLLLPILSGFFLINLFWRDKSSVFSDFLLKLSLSVGLGIGLSSCLYFVLLMFFNDFIRSFIFVESVLAVFLSVFLVYKVRKKNLNINLFFSSFKYRIYQIPLFLTFLASFILAIAFFLINSMNNPYGNWDGWAIWNMRARFIFRGGESFINTFSNLIDWSHPDYPILLPAFIARCWNFVGSETQIIPVLIQLLFTFFTVLLLFSSLSLLRSKVQGLLSGMILLSSLLFIAEGVTQCADIPISFFFLATIVLFYLQDRFVSEKYYFLLLAGVMSGLAIWTKNEGFLFLVCLIIARLLVCIPIKGYKVLFRELMWFTLGLMPVLLIVMYFKLQVAPANDIFSNLTYQSISDKLLDFSRYAQLTDIFKHKILEFSQGIVSPLLIIAYSIVIGIKIEKEDRLNILFSFLLFIFMLIGYTFIYIITPYNLSWHAETSLHRLILQLWPTFIFIYMMIITYPEYYFKKE
ncbi:MAG: hypothetical protein A2287_06760 [Candidatus Melainabacteria bacterium RIFOXYA12_FULL_32_12]|nr:MAG: hypothetical protein A2255_01515 [Candidatus Melainabacteria bacterium RIFOXYA2_FULL_32_9]OGI25815.1 MAG: hypothetical protein A2287_06760 [Candidatus Melainabacteria bacterium RIFOXYA12_FULL_32_12]